MDGIWTVTVRSPDGIETGRLLSASLVARSLAGPVDPAAKAAYLASLMMQADGLGDDGG